MVLPEDLRLSFWLETSSWAQKLPAADALSAGLDLEFAFELTWRSERCLCPIVDNQATFLEATVDRYWPARDSGTSLELLSLDGTDLQTRGLTLDDLRGKCYYLLLSLMRYYREEGLSAKWDEACNRIQAVLPTVSPELTAQFHYERALFALFALNLRQLKNRLAEWPSNDALPFWEAKKASLFAEIGQVNEAKHILKQSLDRIRKKLNLTPPKVDYTLVSQESFVMYLLHAVHQQSLFAASDQSNTQTQRREFRERWHVLKQYKCDPWQEIEIFEHKLERPPATKADVTERPAFDIGRSIQSHHLGGWNKEALTAYNFLRFMEDAGLPFRVTGCVIATKSAAGTLTRIADYSSYWALATLVRIGDRTAVDEVFDRPSLARMKMSAVDSLIERYLESLHVAASDIETGDRWHGQNFGTLLAGVLPEILSRLCCKCSSAAREKLLDWLLEVYRSKHRSNYQGIGNLVRRLLDSSPSIERVAMIPKLLEFPILTDLDPIERREYPNPFDFLDLSRDLKVKDAAVHDIPLDVFFNGASSDSPAAREWAISTLGTLHDAGLLDQTASRRFGGALWSRVDEDGLPSGTNYYRFSFLSLPRPAGIEPVESFVRYVHGARFPAQESQTHIRIEFRGDHGVALCRDIRAARDVQWSKDDVCSIVHRLVQWWDADKAHWRLVRDKKPFPSIAADLGTQLSDLVRTLAVMVVRCPDSVNDERTRSDVTRVAEECCADKVQALQLEIACAYVFASSRDSVLHRVEDAMASSRTESVIDALEAMDMVSHHWASRSDSGDLMQLLRAAGQMIRWRRDTALWATLSAVGEVVNKHPWTFVDDVESYVLAGLGHLVIETAVGGKNGVGIDGNSGLQDVSRKLIVRRAAAKLAHGLFEHYRARGGAIPETVEAWKKVCRSESEFLEIKNEWLAP